MKTVVRQLVTHTMQSTALVFCPVPQTRGPLDPRHGAGSDAVMTPRQAYSALKDEGYQVNYMRTPLTDGAAPREVVFDAFYSGISAADSRDPIIFNDQMGAGRTTTGMVIACMIRSFMDPGEALTCLDVHDGCMPA